MMVWIMVLGLAGWIVPARALTVHIPASKDNTLYENQSGRLSNGSGAHFFAGVTGSGDIRRGLIAFDIAGIIPAGSLITSVTLQLQMSRTTAARQSITLHQVLADWGEGDSNAPQEEGQGTAAAANDATWLHTFFPTSFWVTPGGDFSATVSASTMVSGIGLYTWGSTPQMVAEVQGWLDQPESNFGWILRGNEATFNTAKRFDTKEAAAADRPVLLVEFTPTCNGVLATIIGTDDDEILLGTEEDDVIVGLGGSDIIRGLGGNDTICGGAGDDVLFGDLGSDRLLGEDGNDIIHGGDGPDLLSGGGGHDVLLGEADNDVLIGGDDDDALHGGPGDDQLIGGGGTDMLRGDAGADELNGGAGFDICDGGSDTDPEAQRCEVSGNIP
jgi:Ca2+-binding RTX toxin-like protein